MGLFLQTSNCTRMKVVCGLFLLASVAFFVDAQQVDEGNPTDSQSLEEIVSSGSQYWPRAGQSDSSSPKVLNIDSQTIKEMVNSGKLTPLNNLQLVDILRNDGMVNQTNHVVGDQANAGTTNQTNETIGDKTSDGMRNQTVNVIGNQINDVTLSQTTVGMANQTTVGMANQTNYGMPNQTTVGALGNPTTKGMEPQPDGVTSTPQSKRNKRPQPNGGIGSLQTGWVDRGPNQGSFFIQQDGWTWSQKYGWIKSLQYFTLGRNFARGREYTLVECQGIKPFFMCPGACQSGEAILRFDEDKSLLTSGYPRTIVECPDPRELPHWSECTC